MAELGYNMPSIPHDEGWTGSLGVSKCDPLSAFEKAFYDSEGVFFCPAAATAAAAVENAIAAEAAEAAAIVEAYDTTAFYDYYTAYDLRYGDAEDAEADDADEAEVDDADEAEVDDADEAEADEDSDENMDDLPHEILSPLRALHQFMRNSGVRFAWYLFERSWFYRSQSLQELTVKVILSGKAAQINVAAGDFCEHLEELLLQ